MQALCDGARHTMQPGSTLPLLYPGSPLAPEHRCRSRAPARHCHYSPATSPTAASALPCCFPTFPSCMTIRHCCRCFPHATPPPSTAFCRSPALPTALPCSNSSQHHADPGCMTGTAQHGMEPVLPSVAPVAWADCSSLFVSPHSMGPANSMPCGVARVQPGLGPAMWADHRSFSPSLLLILFEFPLRWREGCGVAKGLPGQKPQNLPVGG